MLRAIHAAEYLLWLADQDKDLVSNMKLQKLLYYAQGYALVRLGRALFDAPIEAWDHGPVVPPVYKCYKQHGDEALPAPAQIQLGRYRSEEREIMDEIYRLYGPFTASTLRNMTHREALWEKVKEGHVIPEARLKEHFMTRANVYPAIVPTERKTWDDVVETIMQEHRGLWEKLAQL